MDSFDDFLNSQNDMEFFEVLQIKRDADARAAIIKVYNEARMSPEQLHAIANEMAQREANTDYKTSQQAIAFHQGVYS